MNKIVLFILFSTIIISCQTNPYLELERNELASGERYDSLFLGVKFGMTSKDFYAHCWDLKGSLLVGSTFAKSFGYSLGIPLIGVNHLKAHAFSHTINKKDFNYPFLSLLVSGGHTQIILVKSYDDMEVVGETRDDAVGEAFDKCAKILGLDYPPRAMVLKK